jgi:hypothetical protein
MNQNRNRDEKRPKDLGTSSDRAMYNDSSEERITNSGGAGNRDAGRTSGGGSGGHTPTHEVQESGRVRNVPEGRDDDKMMDVPPS